MPGLFGGSLFGKQAPTQGLDPDQAQSLGIIQAMQQSQQAGMQRTASPIGSIAQNLLPLFSAMIYAKAADKQAQADAAQAEQDQLSAKLKNALMASQIQKNEQPQQSNLQQEMVNALRNGDRQKLQDLIDTQKAIQKPSADSDYSLLRQANPNASPQELLDLEQQRKMAQGTATATAATTGRIQAERAAKKDLSSNDIDDYVKMTNGISSMGQIMDKLETPGGAPSRLSGAATKLTGGLLSNPFWRQYAAFRNDVINKRFKSRFTGPEGEALAQELPDPMSYAADPQGFLKSVRVAFDHAQGLLKSTYDYDSDVYNMGPHVTLGVLGATQSRGDKKPAGAQPKTVDSLLDQVYGQ